MQKTWSFYLRLSKNKARLQQLILPPQGFRRRIYYEEVSDEEEKKVMDNANVEDKEGEKSHGIRPQKSIFFQSEVRSEIEDIFLQEKQ